MGVLLIFLLTVASAAPLTRVEPAPVRTLVTNVHILHGDAEVTGPHDVMLDEGLITAIGRVGEGFGIKTDRVVDGTGATMMPGLIDAHVHIGSVEALPRVVRLPRADETLDALLFAGVTSVLDPGMSSDDGEKLVRKQEKGKWSGPEVVWAGKPFTAPGGHPYSSVFASFPGPLVRLAGKSMAWPVETEDDVTRAVAKQGRTELMKIMFDDAPGGAPTISDEAAEQVALAAYALDSVLVAHVGRPDDVRRALGLPVDALVHMPWAGRIEDTDAAALARQGVPVAPTLTVWDAVGRYATGDVRDDPWIREIRRDSIDRDVKRYLARGRGRVAPVDPWTVAVAHGADDRIHNAKLLHDADVPLLVGSDTPIYGVPTGVGLHVELDLLQQGGWSNAELLLATTVNNAHLLDRDPDFGWIAEGMQADVLLVNGNPVEDLTVLRDIRALWVNGRWVERVGHGPEE